MNFIKRNIANLITLTRILFALCILFCNFLSLYFFIFYCLALLTDILDGIIARTVKISSSFGSKLDTISDFILAICCVIKLLISISIGWKTIFILSIVIMVKLSSVIVGFIKTNLLFSYHSFLNKVTGCLIAALPFLLLFLDSNFILIFACVFSLLSASIEFLNGYQNNWKSLE